MSDAKCDGCVFQVAEKRRYCKYKAATILKAIKEGKTPTSGPPEETDTNYVGVCIMKLLLLGS